MRTKGRITTWNDEKGFGLITPSAGGKRVFVHIKAFNNRNRRPAVDQMVTYALASDEQGRPCAIRATLAGDRFEENSQRAATSMSVIVAALFLIIVAVSVLSAKIPLFVFALYAVASLLSFVTYALDKSAARKGAWRTQENTLHLLSLAGGWPGALVAQQTLHHKSRKQSFRSLFWITVLANCGVFIWLFTQNGQDALRTLIEAMRRGLTSHQAGNIADASLYATPVSARSSVESLGRIDWPGELRSRFMKMSRVDIHFVAYAMAILLLSNGSMAFAQTPQERVHAMSRNVMPFDMSKTIHIFKMTESGGIERIVVRDPRDADQVVIIRRHLKREAGKFQRGDYSDPAKLHGSDMPGLKELEANASQIKISYSELPKGAQITFKTMSRRLLTAIHRWFGAQLSEHGADAKAE